MGGGITAQDLTYACNPFCDEFDAGVVSNFVDYVRENIEKYSVCRLTSTVAANLPKHELGKRLHWEGGLTASHLKEVVPFLTARILYKELDRNIKNIDTGALKRINEEVFVEDGFRYLLGFFPSPDIPIPIGKGSDNLQGCLFGR